ncbi:ubiquitin carboxyl-terminal hydrolase-domain-containing protein [Dactylonectria estremocensis]|uniref:ubiquitinyl hydrolase 1 n=1 Tax=Dactylonectria estremocensis TaxID=1079267 RepID=A0A9P9F0N2_9HYPO|nr:ubiquitin carboxyl-terminal hydrolase-domain-containing protein [Dactylonectria estremocensis]
MKEFPRKFLSLRDKNGSSRRAKSNPPPIPAAPSSNKPRPLSAGAFMALFKADNSKHSPKVDAEKEKDTAAQVEEVMKRLDELNITNVTVDHINDIMATNFAAGDPKKAAEFIDIEQKAAAGIISRYDPSIDMVGAENRGNVTCYLDALLFAMFSKLDAFECMLKNDFPEDDSRAKLVTLLRMWVNMLRTGKLIHTDLTKLIQDALADSGWSDARMLEQQDTSEAFAFITETLQLPLLSLQVDLFHQGKRDKDDHKVVYERLLNLAVPPDPDEKGIKLEDCLEEYFNAQVDVQRDSEEAKKASLQEMSRSDHPRLIHRDTIRLITEEMGESSTPTVMASPIAMSPLQRTPTLEKGPLLAFPELKPEEDSKPEDSEPKEGEEGEPPGKTPDKTPGEPPSEPPNEHPNEEQNGKAISSEAELAVPRPKPAIRARSTSVIQRVLLDEQGRASSPDNPTMLQKAMRKGSTVVKAVTIPAWQFFRLIPWHALTSNEPRSNVDVALNFDQRPVVGICLKRYAMTESGQPKRHNTFIDIPDSLRLPHFMMADDPKAEEDPNPLSDYKLVLQSVICHRGDSLQSGHYIAFSRVAPKLLTKNRRHDFDPPPDYEEAQWVRFDDLQIEKRVTYVDDIKQSLKDEMPYLLFYQIVPVVEVTAPSVEDTETEPPSYNESKVSIELPPTPTRVDSNQLVILGQEEGYFDNTPTATSSQLHASKPPSIRLSSDSERLPRRSGEILDSHFGSFLGDSRRPSVNWTDSTSATPAVTPNSHSPAITPSEESTSSRLSRAASRFTKANRSRPSSQTGENRISFSMTRYVGLMRPSKEPLVDTNGLGTSSANSTGPLTLESSIEKDDSPTQPEPEQPHIHHHHAHKHGHKRIRSKDKTNKNKHSSQPERECTVM